jgi:dTDP-4-dehydrorhamnose reductase
VRLERGCDDQGERTGHYHRLEDLDRIAGLGLRTLRYPVLWERHAGTPIDWRGTDERLHRLRAHGIRPIVGFLHHGCGPLPGGFLDPGFVDGLARFARAFAERYPWVDAYTPVNEPLTTARFSGLYGVWHPFSTDPRVFARCLLNQFHGIRATMRAVREVNPAAQLIQTEDLGKTHSTDCLAYQADWENERRWITFDVLCGRLAPGMMMHAHLCWAGIKEQELNSFLHDPCPPDVCGMNHYVTSERMLDHRVESYPPGFDGGNGRDRYADVPAVRVRAEGPAGPAALMRELWERYHRPLAVTEVQLACTREEQLRWLLEVWQGAQSLREEGIDVRAITAWALFGAVDWDSLLLHPSGHYENGAFDVSGGEPVETALAHALRELARTGQFHHPVAEGAGWWRRAVRFVFRPASAARTGPGTASSARSLAESALLIVVEPGATRDAYARLCDLRGINAEFIAAEQFCRAGPNAMAAFLDAHAPWGIVVEPEGDVELPEHFCVLCAERRIAVACAEDEHTVRVTHSDDIVTWQVCDGDRCAPDPEQCDRINVTLNRLIDRSVALRTGQQIGCGAVEAADFARERRRRHA